MVAKILCFGSTFRNTFKWSLNIENPGVLIINYLQGLSNAKLITVYPAYKTQINAHKTQTKAEPFTFHVIQV
jgi:hypothetical protein